MSALLLRPATSADEALLWRALTFAASMPGGDTDANVAAARDDPELRPYVEAFGRDGDLGVVAELGNTPAGAAWVRLHHGSPSPTKVWTHEVPELAIATFPAARGAGVGTRLLGTLLGAARTRYPAVALTVREESVCQPGPQLHRRSRLGGESRPNFR